MASPGMRATCSRKLTWELQQCEANYDVCKYNELVFMKEFAYWPDG